VVLGISYLWAARQSRRYAALGKLNEDAVRLIDAGELASASRLLDEALNACDPSYACRGIWEFNRGLAHMRQGHLDIAIASFEAALRNKGVLVGAEQFLTRLRCQLAIAHAIHGEFTAAEQAEARAHDRAAPDMNGALLFMHILIGVRAGRYATMVKDAADEWPKAEGCLDVHQYKIMRLLLAFGHSQLPDAPAHAQHIQQMLAGVHPFRPGEFDYLVVNWPEFRAFLVEHGFVTQNSVPQPAAAPANLKSAT
jgi:tetratricopeptide (TPR) repeat protein